MTAHPTPRDTPCANISCEHDACRRERLVVAHLGLAQHLARRFAHRGVPLEDLVQVASLAVVHAAARFDETLGLSFSTFVAPTILGEIKHHFRDRLWDLRVPRRVQDLHVTLNRLVDPLTHTLGRSPTLQELARAAQVSSHDVLEALEAGHAFSTRSIDAAPDPDGYPSATHLWPVDDELESVEERLTVAALLAELPPREQLVVRLRFYENMSQRQIADRLGISQMHVSRLLARSLEQLRASADRAEPAERTRPDQTRHATR